MVRRLPHRDTLLRVCLVGVASGFRSQSGLAVVALSSPAGEPTWPARLFVSPWAKGVSATAAAGELVADKLPATPSRLGSTGFASRVALGALAASALAGRRRQPPAWWVAAAVGGAAAAGGTVAGAAWRRTARERGHPDWPAAIVEDLAALALSYLACVEGSRQHTGKTPEGD